MEEEMRVMPGMATVVIGEEEFIVDDEGVVTLDCSMLVLNAKLDGVELVDIKVFLKMAEKVTENPDGTLAFGPAKLVPVIVDPPLIEEINTLYRNQIGINIH